MLRPLQSCLQPAHAGVRQPCDQFAEAGRCTQQLHGSDRLDAVDEPCAGAPAACRCASSLHFQAASEQASCRPLCRLRVSADMPYNSFLTIVQETSTQSPPGNLSNQSLTRQYAPSPTHWCAWAIRSHVCRRQRRADLIKASCMMPPARRVKPCGSSAINCRWWHTVWVADLPLGRPIALLVDALTLGYSSPVSETKTFPAGSMRNKVQVLVHSANLLQAFPFRQPCQVSNNDISLKQTGIS